MSGVHGARMTDVARVAGVSVKTVSNVVNEYPHVAPSTRARVLEAIQELNYRPHAIGRHLRRGRTGLLALAVPELDVPYFGELAALIVDVADERGYTVLIDQTNGDIARETIVMEGFRTRLIDGIIFSPLRAEITELVGRRDDTPMVLLGERISGGPIDHVAVDNIPAAAAVVEHMIGLGRRRIAYVGAEGPVRIGTGHLRHLGYLKALEAAGIEPNPAYQVQAGRWRRQDGVEQASVLLGLDEPPDAIFCATDTIALGVLFGLRRAGVRVPDDIALAGFDDVEESQYSEPPLTTVAPDMRLLARTAMNLLLLRVEGDPDAPPPQDIAIPHHLVVRESTTGTRA